MSRSFCARRRKTCSLRPTRRQSCSLRSSKPKIETTFDRILRERTVGGVEHRQRRQVEQLAIDDEQMHLRSCVARCAFMSAASPTTFCFDNETYIDEPRRSPAVCRRRHSQRPGAISFACLDPTYGKRQRLLRYRDFDRLTRRRRVILLRICKKSR